LERLELRKAMERLERTAVVECWRAASLFLEAAFEVKKRPLSSEKMPFMLS
jgi:hypothetical protein